MRALRSKWLPHDNDASLSLKAMILYDEVIKTGLKTPEQNFITRHVNQQLSYELKNPKESPIAFSLDTRYNESD